MILMSLYYALIQLSNKIPLMLGGSWSYFVSWLRSLVMFALGMKELVIMAYAAARALGPLKVLTSLLWPIDRLSNVLFIFIATVYGLAVFIKNYYYLLMAIGVVLYAMPFRLGRSAGAWLLAFAIVFNAGLPLLPVFVSAFYSEQQRGVTPVVNYGLVYAKVNVTDLSGRPLNYGISYFYVMTDQGTLKLVGKYIVSNNGILRSRYSNDYVPLPSRKRIYSYIEINSLQMPLYPFPASAADITGTEGTLKLVAENIVWHRGDLIVVTNASKVYILKVSNNTIKFRVNESHYFIDVRSPSRCNYLLNVQGDVLKTEEGTWSWLNVKGSYRRLYLNGTSITQIDVSSECAVNPSYPQPFDYYIDFLGEGIFLDTNLIRSIIVMYLTLPLMYIFVLFSIAYALARLIGGRERILPRFI
jgi:hypothetical protein